MAYCANIERVLHVLPSRVAHGQQRHPHRSAFVSHHPEVGDHLVLVVATDVAVYRDGICAKCDDIRNARDEPLVVGIRGKGCARGYVNDEAELRTYARASEGYQAFVDYDCGGSTFRYLVYRAPYIGYPFDWTERDPVVQGDDDGPRGLLIEDPSEPDRFPYHAPHLECRANLCQCTRHVAGCINPLLPKCGAEAYIGRNINLLLYTSNHRLLCGTRLRTTSRSPLHRPRLPDTS